MKRWRWLALAGSGLGLSGASAVLVLAFSSLPELSGSASVHGLGAPLTIVRDAHAIPHIYAQDPNDAYFGLGYVHAQDRLWQLEQSRRVATGTLAEVIGERALDSDRLFRALGFARRARENYARLDAETRAALDAYARGVNAWLDSAPALPPEFRLLGHRPAPWTPTNSLEFIRLLAWQLSGNWSEELWRVRLSSVLSPEQLAEFAPPYPGYEALPLAELLHVYARLDIDLLPAPAPHGALSPDPLANAGAARLAAFAPAAAWLGPLAPSGFGNAVGSNNWVVDSRRSQTGKPLLANDPHLELTAPSEWYLAHLEAPGWSVIGATLPALPGIILGHNSSVAWAFTNTFPDAQDVYLERLAPGVPDQYLGPQGPLPFEIWHETIQVRGAADVQVELRQTRHGPVISDVSDEARRCLPEGYVLSLAWTALQADDLTASFPVRAARAQGATELREAARTFHAATQNIVYADVEGNIGFVAAGRVPLRRPDNELRGSLPAPGWLERYDWVGLVPFEELPALEAPVSGRIVTANQRITPPGYSHWLGADWGPPYRADRIGVLLDATAQHSLESLAAIQGDVRSSIADRLLEPMLSALPEPLTDLERESAQALQNWDRAMRPEMREPLLFAAWVRQLAREIYADELGDSFQDEWAERPEFLHNVLTQPGLARWCDDQRTPAREACSSRVGNALGAALRELGERFGFDPRQWSWGIAHPSISEHPLWAHVPLLARWANLSVPRGGDGSSVNVGSYWLADEKGPFHNAWGPGFRALYDLSNLNRSLAILNSGQSGHLLSPYYRDMSPLWASGHYVPLTTERPLLQDGAIGSRVLTPIPVDNNSH